MQGFLNRASLTVEAIAVRPAQLSDRAAIHRLSEDHHRVHFNLDWWSFDQWLHADRSSEAIWLAFDQDELIGLLVAPFEQSPVVWLRAMAIANGYSAAPVFTALFTHARSALLAQDVEQVAVLAHPEWVGDLTQRLNFTLYNEIVSMRKSDRTVPDLRRSPVASIRPARPEDIPAIADNDRASFDTIWWHSAASLAHILKTVSQFIVAEVDDRVVGHAFSDVYGGHGHLIRLVVHPAYQRRGIGEQLLRESLLHQNKMGAYPLTLNTQIDNAASQVLYRRYGYQLNGRPVRVMQSVTNDE
jgi:ribosomal protein S18 acetylase RimI-like enzyme